MDKAVEEAIATCGLCQSSDKVAQPRNTPLQPVPLPHGPWEKLGIDITGPFEGKCECRYAIVLIDYYSKWVEMAFVAEVTSKSVIAFLFQVFCGKDCQVRSFLITAPSLCPLNSKLSSRICRFVI